MALICQEMQAEESGKLYDISRNMDTQNKTIILNKSERDVITKK